VYADLSIDVDASGFVTIKGVTNYPNLLVNNSPMYTIKEQEYWVLNITTDMVFSDAIYKLFLPEGSSINYIRSSGFFSIKEHDGRLVVNGVGENITLSVVVQYQLEKSVSEISISLDDAVFVVLLLLIGILMIALIVLYLNERKKTHGDSLLKKNAAINTMKGLSQRQQEIMTLLQERQRPLTQTDIQKELGIPKAAVSRNIHGLERKGLIEKEQIGMSNLIRLKKL